MLQPLKHVCLYLEKLQKDGKKEKFILFNLTQLKPRPVNSFSFKWSKPKNVIYFSGTNLRGVIL